MKNKKILLSIIESGIANVQLNEQIINDLNVFPIPDGDTGSNMLSTLRSGYNSAKEFIETNINNKAVDFFATFAKGTLYGARGNSGVITSQIMKGLAKGVENHGSDFDDSKVVKGILNDMKTYAYNSVPNPVEGTILSIIRYTAENFQGKGNNYKTYFDEIVELAEFALEETPNQLPILKESGVVDSGGMGIVLFYKGVQLHFNKKGLKLYASNTKEEVFRKADAFKNIGYCSEFILTLKEVDKYDKAYFQQILNKMGDSIVLIIEDDILKVHIHVKEPGTLLNTFQEYGQFSKIKIENMTTQVDENPMVLENGYDKEQIGKKTKKTKALGVISVSEGEGITKIMEEKGVDCIINGGQTDNPSVEDFVSAINSLENEEIIILPNNSNIIMAAKSAIELINDKKVYLLPTKSVQQGLAVLFNYSKEFVPFHEYEDFLINIIKELSFGSITVANRDVTLNGVDVKEGQYIAISEKQIIASNKDFLTSVYNLLDKIITDEQEIVYIIYNHEIKAEELKSIKNHLVKNFDIQIEFIFGKQKIYHLLVFGE